jgi:DNA polymerase-1
MKTFNEIQELENTLMIVDALNLAFRWKHSGAIEFKDDFIRTIDSLKKSYKAKYVVIACDKGSSSYRKAIYPDYKQNRKDKYESQTPEEQKAFELFFEEFTETIQEIEKQGKYIVFRFDKVEADDIAAYIVKKRKLFPVDRIVLVSSDKDWDLLIKPDIIRFSYVTRKEVSHDNWNNHYDCTPDEFISIKCLQGDSGDNVPGVPGVGPKKALSLIKEYGSAYDIIANLPIQSKYKYIHALNEFGVDNLIRNYQLMDLIEFCEEALGDINCHRINTVLGDYISAGKIQ